MSTSMFILRFVYHFFIDTAQTFLLVASLFLVIYLFLYRPFQVSGRSMFPTFYDKEYVFTDLINYRFNLPKKGEVIVFEAPDDPEKDYIKRIIGLPGDSVFIRDGSVYLNNQKLDESKYLDSSVKTYGEKFLRDGETVIVEPGEYFVLGDNRPESADSRQWGFVKREKIIGRSLFVYWPINRMRKIVNPYLPN